VTRFKLVLICCTTHAYPVLLHQDDLQGQLRFLRVPQFTRDAFWKNAISEPYYAHNTQALQVLRSVLSRFVVRHSKEQTDKNGEAMMQLPPRTVETVILPFCSEAEKKVYDYLEKRNMDYFLELRRESPADVLKKYIELTGMQYSARQACAHASLIDLSKLNEFNLNRERERERERLKKGNNIVPRPMPPNGRMDRASILEQAVSNAPESAKGRVRDILLKFHEGEIEAIECPICFDPIPENRCAITPVSTSLFRIIVRLQYVSPVICMSGVVWAPVL
jgi:SNF2 family DNA or RNA helicase